MKERKNKEQQQKYDQSNNNDMNYRIPIRFLEHMHGGHTIQLLAEVLGSVEDLTLLLDELEEVHLQEQVDAIANECLVLTD